MIKGRVHKKKTQLINKGNKQMTEEQMVSKHLKNYMTYLTIKGIKLKYGFCLTKQKAIKIRLFQSMRV